MKKIICILLALLLLCACAPQATSSTEPSSVTSSGQLHGIMSVPLLSMISVDYSISVPNETPSSEPSTVTSAPNISAVSSEDFSVPSTEVSQVPSTRSRPQKVEGDPADYYPPYKFYPLQYADPFTDDFDSLVALLDDPVRTKDGPLSEEDIKQLLKVTLPLGMRLTYDISYQTLPFLFEEDTIDIDLGSDFYYWRTGENPYGNISVMKNYCEMVFSKNTTEKSLYPIAFHGECPCYIEVDGILYVLSGDQLFYTSYCLEWQLDTLKIVSQNENELLIEIDYVDCAYDFSYNLGKIRMIKEDGIWKFNNHLSEEIVDATELWYVHVHPYFRSDKNK